VWLQNGKPGFFATSGVIAHERLFSAVNCRPGTALRYLRSLLFKNFWEQKVME
jgi:hypothetical protein